MVGVGSEWGEWSGSDGSSRGTRGLPISVTPSSLRRAVGVGLHHLFTVACAFRLFWSASSSSSSIPPFFHHSSRFSSRLNPRTLLSLLSLFSSRRLFQAEESVCCYVWRRLID